MRRREFTTLLGGAVTWPIMARGQQLGGTLPRVVQLSPADNPSQADGTRRLLRELGYVEGRNIQIEFRNTGGNADALPTMAEEMVREMEDKPKGKKGKKPAASKSKGGKNDLGSLAALIQQRQKGRADNFLADLEAKYGGGKKRGSPALYDEPSEEAFQKTAARGKKAKAAKEEASGAAGDGSRSKRARK